MKVARAAVVKFVATVFHDPFHNARDIFLRSWVKKLLRARVAQYSKMPYIAHSCHL